MGIFSKKTAGGGFMDVIRCDEPSYLIWKWHPEGTVAGNNRRENAIRWGSTLRVKAGSVAVFVYSQNDGTQQEFIEGPFDDIIETNNFPVLASIVGLAYEGESPFQAEVYFINLAQLIQLKFAVPYFDVYDPRFLDYGVPVAVRGTISFRITDYREFIELHRLETFTLDDFQNQVKHAVSRYVKSAVSNAPDENGIPVVQLERKIEQINDIVESKVKNRLFDEFGVTVSSLDIAAIDIDKDSEGYQQLKVVTQDLTTATMKAKTEVDIKEMRDSQRLGILERAGRTFVDIKEGAYTRHKQTQTANYTAYQTEAQEHVGVAGAHGLGMMGASGGGNIGDGGGMNPAAMMAGMAVGGAIGQNIAGTMMGSMNQQQLYAQQQASKQTPPPIGGVMYNVAVNGQPTGPFDMATLRKMIVAGEILKESLVWTKGMNTWQKAGEVDDIKEMFTEMPQIPFDDNTESMPPIPKKEGE
ncbi:SPFH domain-containing protein [Butyrivibrio fibrisolvens]|uniref:SPFH domain-containing protein n=1 Tax=Butyrivibrio fibrisolvens TaxID=831 RepID=UPI000426337C|nr:SPFH domain-containing protein [Butyrivibrio fibrisolvens]